MNWSVLIGLLVVQTGYLLGTGPWRHRFAAANGGTTPAPVTVGRQLTFLGGILAIGLALVSPIDQLAGLLQSMHMVQHVLITLIAPPLLLLGTPGWLLRPALAWPGVGWVAYRLTRAKLAFAIGNMTFILWHIPAFYDLALRVPPVHILEHITMLTTALLMWWPIAGMLPELPSLPQPMQMLYVVLMTITSSLLGIILGMAREPLYPTYSSGPRLWGLTPLADQQLSGLIMWVGANMFWLGVLTAIFFVWNAREEAEEQATIAADAASRAESRSGEGLAGSGL